MSKPMTASQTLAAFKAEGIVVVEYTGWKSRCRCCPDDVAHRPNGPYIRGWGDVNGQLAHITAGRLGGRSVEKYIRDIINGDPGTPCKSQTVIAPDGRVYVNSTGRCNHAGKVGGQVRSHLRAADFSLSDDFDNRFTGGSADGNAFTYGDEVIAASKMNAAQYDALVRVHAARARFHGWSGQESVGHGEVSNQRGKGDPNLHMGNFRKDVMARVRAGTSPKPTTPPPVVKPVPAPSPEPTTKTVDVEVMFLPMAGSQPKGAEGYDEWRRNVKGLAALVEKHDPDFVGTTELATKYIPMRPAFEEALPTYARGGGGDGRYVYRRKATTDHIAGGVVEAAASTLLNDDDKQAGWSVDRIHGVKVGVISGHLEHENGIDRSGPNKGADADDLRVKQMFSLVNQAVKKIKAQGVKDEHIIAVFDTNSESWVKNAMIKAGWKEIGPGYFTRWNDTAKTPLDWGFIRPGSGAKVKARINHDFSDHTALIITWTIRVPA